MPPVTQIEKGDHSTTNNGYLIWKIYTFMESVRNLDTGETLASYPSYTGPFGYKFRVKLEPYVDLKHGKCLALFFELMESAFDNILEWPFKKKVKGRLLNQEGRKKDTFWKNFYKTERETKIEFVCEMLICLSKLTEEGFLKDGCLYIEIKVE